MDNNSSFYAVATGHEPGIYESWEGSERQRVARGVLEGLPTLYFCLSLCPRGSINRWGIQRKSRSWGAGAVIRRPGGPVVCELSLGLGTATNNVAEYKGLIIGMTEALALGIERLQVQGDSKLVTMQVLGQWKINNYSPAVLCSEVIQLREKFKEFQIRHVDREYNCAADALAINAVGLPEGKFLSSCPHSNQSFGENTSH